MRARRVNDDLLVENLPGAEWLRALLFLAAGTFGMVTFAPPAGAAPVGAAGLLLLVSLAMTAVGLWYALRTRGDRVAFSAEEREATLRSVGLLPGRMLRVLPLDDIGEVLVNVRGDTGGGARWRPVLRVAGEEVPLSRNWFAERAACESVATELRAWLSEHGVAAPARAAREEQT